MQIAFALFPGYTALDLLGPYSVLAHAGGSSESVVFVAEHTGEVIDSGRLSVTAHASFDEITRPDIIVVPGGLPAITIAREGKNPIIDWIAAVHPTTTWTTSVCTGSLLLGAAGILRGVRATTHWYTHGELADHGAIPVDERVVFDGKIATAAGVSAGIDMALALAGKIGGDAAGQMLELDMEYNPRPPYGTGHPSIAPTDLTAQLSDMYRAALDQR